MPRKIKLRDTPGIETDKKRYNEIEKTLNWKGSPGDHEGVRLGAELIFAFLRNHQRMTNSIEKETIERFERGLYSDDDDMIFLTIAEMCVAFQRMKKVDVGPRRVLNRLRNGDSAFGAMVPVLLDEKGVKRVSIHQRRNEWPSEYDEKTMKIIPNYLVEALCKTRRERNVYDWDYKDPRVIESVLLEKKRIGNHLDVKIYTHHI